MNKAQEAIFVALKNAHCDVRVAEERICMHQEAVAKNLALQYDAYEAIAQLSFAGCTLGLTEAEIEQAGEWVKE